MGTWRNLDFHYLFCESPGVEEGGVWDSQLTTGGIHRPSIQKGPWKHFPTIIANRLEDKENIKKGCNKVVCKLLSITFSFFFDKALCILFKHCMFSNLLWEQKTTTSHFKNISTKIYVTLHAASNISSWVQSSFRGQAKKYHKEEYFDGWYGRIQLYYYYSQTLHCQQLSLSVSNTMEEYTTKT